MLTVMKFDNNIGSLALSSVIGATIGYVGGPVWILVIWAIAGLLIGRYAKNSKTAALNGIAFGFFISYAFMIGGYSGEQPLSSRLVPFLIFGLVGALFGAVLCFLGNHTKH